MVKKIVAIITTVILGVSISACAVIEDITGSVSTISENSSSVNSNSETNSLEKESSSLDSKDLNVFVRESDLGVSEIRLYHKGDNLYKQVTINRLNLDEYSKTKDKDEFLSATELDAQMYNSVPGINYVSEIVGNEFIETITVDFASLDGEMAKRIPGIVLNGDAREVSYSATVEQLVFMKGYVAKN